MGLVHPQERFLAMAESGEFLRGACWDDHWSGMEDGVPGLVCTATGISDRTSCDQLDWRRSSCY